MIEYSSLSAWAGRPAAPGCAGARRINAGSMKATYWPFTLFWVWGVGVGESGSCYAGSFEFPLLTKYL